MAIVVNGVELGDCNTVIVNGTPAHQVVVNGTVVWTNSCFDGIWSGDIWTNAFSQVCCPAPNGETCVGRSFNFGMDVSGNGYRQYQWNGIAGAWLYADENGLDTGESRIASSSEDAAIITTPTSIRWEFVPTNTYSTVSHSGSVTFDKENGFSGTQEAIHTRWDTPVIYGYTHILRWETSGGQLRFYEKYHNDAGCTMFEGTSQWVTLT